MCVICRRKNKNKSVVSVKNKNNTMTKNEISNIISGAIFKVYNELGAGLFESVYEAALLYQIQKDGLAVKPQVLVPVFMMG